MRAHESGALRYEAWQDKARPTPVEFIEYTQVVANAAFTALPHRR